MDFPCGIAHLRPEHLRLCLACPGHDGEDALRAFARARRPIDFNDNTDQKSRHHRASPGDPRSDFVTARKTWMAGTSARSKASSPRPAMTTADSRVNCLTDTPPRSRRACARVLPVD